MATAVCALMLALPVTLLAACSGTELKPFSQYSEYAVKAADDSDSGDAKWAAYLKSHFQKRATDRDCIIAGKAQDDSQLQLVAAWTVTTRWLWLRTKSDSRRALPKRCSGCNTSS